MHVDRIVERVNPEAVQRFLAAQGFSRGITRADERELLHLSRRRDAVRRHNPTVGGMEERIDQPIYDTFSINANTSFPKTVLFQSPIGQGGKTLAQTNLVVGGQLQFPQALEVHSYSVVIANNTTLVDLINIQTNVSFTLTIGTKWMIQVPVWFLPAGCGAILNAIAGIGSSLPATAAVGYSTSNGIQDIRSVFSLSQVYRIESGESFNTTLNPETPFTTQATTTNPAGVGTSIAVKLDGVLYRGVQ